jgi:hypothetical protein
MENTGRKNGLFQSIRKPDLESVSEKRRYPRRDCFYSLDYMVQDRRYRGFLRNVSEAGAHIRPGARFCVGDEILLYPPSPVSRNHIRGTIAWVESGGMGVKFLKLECADKAADSRRIEGSGDNIFRLGKECRKMGKVRKRRVHWEPAVSEGVTKYRIYWAAGRPVDYDSDHVEVQNVTQVVLPDDIPSFPLIAGEIELGVSAVNNAGNESELTRATVYFDFTIPEAPRNLMVEDM